MTSIEAVKLLKIIRQADGGCSYCASNLALDLFRDFPYVDWITAISEIDEGDRNPFLSALEGKVYD